MARDNVSVRSVKKTLSCTVLIDLRNAVWGGEDVRANARKLEDLNTMVLVSSGQQLLNQRGFNLERAGRTAQIAGFDT